MALLLALCNPRQMLLDATITVATPEGVVLSAPLADPIRRMWALMIDLIILGVLLFLLAFLVIFSASKITLGVGGVIAFLLLWGYFFFGEYFFNGKTLGKKILKIKVVNADLTPLSMQAALWRNILRYVDFLPSCFGVGLFFILFSPQHQRFGDWLAGTVVIDEEKDFSRPQPISATPAPLPWVLTHEERQTLLNFARYAQKFSPARSEEMAAIFRPLLPELSDRERVEKLSAFAAWIEQGGRPQGMTT